MSDIHTKLNVQAESDLTIEQRLNLQTAKIAWSELLRSFAAGKVVYVDQSLDLIEVAAAMHRDDTGRIARLMASGRVALVSDAQALAWTNISADLWAVVVSPWVLVQELKLAS